MDLCIWVGLVVKWECGASWSNFSVTLWWLITLDLEEQTWHYLKGSFIENLQTGSWRFQIGSLVCLLIPHLLISFRVLLLCVLLISVFLVFDDVCCECLLILGYFLLIFKLVNWRNIWFKLVRIVIFVMCFCLNF